MSGPAPPEFLWMWPSVKRSLYTPAVHCISKVDADLVEYDVVTTCQSVCRTTSDPKGGIEGSGSGDFAGRQRVKPTKTWSEPTSCSTAAGFMQWSWVVWWNCWLWSEECKDLLRSSHCGSCSLAVSQSQPVCDSTMTSAQTLNCSKTQ